MTSPTIQKLVLAGVTMNAAQSAALVMEGLTNAEIAERRFLSPKTIKWHFNTTFKVIGVKNRSQLILWIVKTA